MNIIFKIIKDEQEVKIINKADGQVVGRIFTPSGTSRDKDSAIQVCGFDDCFELWGCGIFGDGKGTPKKDIQLLFNENSTQDSSLRKDIISSHKCAKCFHYYKDKDGNKDVKGKCRCNDLRVKEFKELVLDKIEK